MYDKSLRSKSMLGYHFIPFKIIVSILTLKILFKPGVFTPYVTPGSSHTQYYFPFSHSDSPFSPHFERIGSPLPFYIPLLLRH